jgi:hypothetical protein
MGLAQERGEVACLEEDGWGAAVDGWGAAAGAVVDNITSYQFKAYT